MGNSTSHKSETFTGLILLSGVDAPGITQALFHTLEPFQVSILDIEQVVIRGRLILTLLISLSPGHAQAIEDDLSILEKQLGVDIAATFEAQPVTSIAAKTELVHVVLLSENLKPHPISLIAAEITKLHGNIERIHRTASYPIVAIEFIISGASVSSLQQKLAPTAASLGVDLAVSPGGLMRHAKRLVVMDVDSTLIQQEVIELLAAKAGCEAKVKEITESAMRGEIDFSESLQQRVSLLEGLPATVLQEVSDEIRLTPGARTLVRTLQKLGHTVAVVSGGFGEIIEPLLRKLDITLYRTNALEIINGVITGRIDGPIIDRAGKAQALHEFAQLEKIDLEQTIAIGDGANDLDMITLAGFGIAFNAKPAVKAAADSSVSAPYLDSVLYLLGISREEIEEAATTKKNI